MRVNNDFWRWSAEQRSKSLDETNKAINCGCIKPANEYSCVICGCGKDEGKEIKYHNKNYCHPTKDLIPLCRGCHLSLHLQINKGAVRYLEFEEFEGLQNNTIERLTKDKQGAKDET